MASSPLAPAENDKRPLRKLWLGVTVVLFVGWIGWLAYLAFTTTKPIVLSRPQFLVSDLDVIALVDGLDQPVTVKEIAWPQTDAAKKLIDTQINVENLRDCQDHGWNGPGPYILPLVMEGVSCRVAAIPPSPGLPRGDKPRVYRATPETRAQLRQIRKPNG